MGVPTVTEIIDLIWSMPAGKAAGPDGLPIEVWRAAGQEMMHQLALLVRRVLAAGHFPLAWRGGRLVPLYKGKGDHADMACKRPLTISDHAGKVAARACKIAADDIYDKWLQQEQCGCRRALGTDFASLMVKAFIHRSRAKDHSFCVLFLDLVAAFDSIIREKAPGMLDARAPEDNFVQALCENGLPEESARQLAEEVACAGSLLEQLEVSPAIVAAMRSLHQGTWFEVANQKQKVVTAKGGRQGCPLGAFLFNLAYSRALWEVEHELRRADVILVLPGFSLEGPAPQETVLQATFVDDQTWLLEASSPTRLDAAIDVLLSAVAKVFRHHALTVNWKKGKTEALLSYRGRHAATFYRKRTREGGGLGIKLPSGAGSDYVSVVRQYKHLGGIITTKAIMEEEIMARTGQGQGALSQLARLTARKELPAALKLNVVAACSWSRLCNNAHTWEALPARLLAQLEAVYHQGLRRATGHTWRKEVACQLPSAALLEALGRPSFECFLRRRRLSFLVRLLRSGPPPLLALLFEPWRSSWLPWTQQLISDLMLLWRGMPALAAMPAPDQDLLAWLRFVAQWPREWKQLVKRHLCFDTSADRKAATKQVEDRALRGHVCGETGCSMAFLTAKALAQHARRAHGKRSQFNAYVAADGRCPVCGKVFASRLRCIAHLNDGRELRGGKCADRIRQGECIRLRDELVVELDAIDTEARRVARAQGHTQPLVPGSHR